MYKKKILSLAVCLVMATLTIEAEAALKKDNSADPKAAYNPREDKGDIELPMPNGMKMVMRAVPIDCGDYYYDKKILLGVKNLDSGDGEKGAEGDEGRAIYEKTYNSYISSSIMYNDLPKSWQWYRLGQIVRISIGKTPARGDVRYWSNATKPWVSISDMADYSHIKTTKERISDTAASTLMGAISPRGSLLMSFKLTVGRTSILDIEAYHNEAIISIYPYIDEEYALRDFLFYSLPILANMGDSKDAIKGKTLNSKSLNGLLIPLPPLKEQRHIIQRLEELYAHL